MISKPCRWIIPFAVLVLASLACKTLSGEKTPENPAATEPSTIVDVPAPTQKPAERGGSVTLGDEFRSEEGGYLFKTVPDYKLESFFGLTTLSAPDAIEDIGPYIMIVGGVNEEATTNDQLTDKFMADIETDVTVTGQKEITVDGIAMIQVDMTGKEGDQDVVVRAVMGMVSSTHEFSMFGVAPQSRWDSEVGPIFEAVLDSISFFEPSVPEIGLPEITPEPPQELAELRQWAFFAEGSSEYGNPDWAASQVQGEPDTFDCGDQVTAWATSDKTSTDWVDLYYETPVIPTEVNIYQTYNPGYITLVELRDEAGGIYTVYEAEASPLDECPDILAIPVTNVMNEVVSIRITMDQSSIASESIWSEIDAVELVGLSMGDFGALPDSYNFEDIPVYEGAEEVMSFDGMLSFLVSADRAAVRDFYLEELPKLGWQLDLDENGNCVDENRCMGQFFNYDDPENLTWGFIQGEDAQLNLTIINEGDKLRVSITL